jgi:hypothetical protein
MKIHKKTSNENENLKIKLSKSQWKQIGIKTGWLNKTTQETQETQNGELGELWLLRHEYDKLDLNQPIQPKPAYKAVDAFAKPAVYATPNKDLVIAWGMMPLGADSGILSTNPLKMVIFDGQKPRMGGKIYLYRMPTNIRWENMGEAFMSQEPVKPIAEEVVNVNDYLKLVSEATQEDIKLRDQYIKA